MKDSGGSGHGLEPSNDRRVYENILGAIGDTPLVRLNQVSRRLSCSLYAKLEYLNPGGSVKDRIGFPILEDFEKEGKLEAGGTVVEATSGNTGVGLAIACSLKGYKAIFVMPDKMSEEKIRLLRAYGARVVITPTAVEPDDPRSYYSVAQRLVEETPRSVLANQYHNPVNPQSHYETTAPEIWEQTGGRVTDIVVGMGTGGTITGIARYVREHDLPVKIVGVDPEGSILYDAWRAGGDTSGLVAQSYKVEGIGEDFIPSTLDLSMVDEVVKVNDKESFVWTRRLVREEGIFSGGSCGAALAGAIKYAADLERERVVVVLFPDSGYRYLSKVFNDDWMRENGFLDTDRRRISALDVATARGLPSLITARPEDKVIDVIGRMRDQAVSQLPVVDDEGRLAGMVTEVELLNHVISSDHEHGPDETIGSLEARPVKASSSQTPLAEILPDLLEQKVVILTDEFERPVSILTTIDALEFIATADDGENST